MHDNDDHSGHRLRGWRALDAESFRAIFEHSIDGVLFTVPDGQILAANAAACDLLRLSEREIRKRGRSGLADATDSRWADAVAERERAGDVRTQVRMRRGDGSVFTVDLASAIFHEASGERRACVIFRDLSAQVAMASELAVFEERERIAQQVYERVVLRLSGIAMDLDGLRSRTRDPHVASRAADLAADIDTILTEAQQSLAEDYRQRRRAVPAGSATSVRGRLRQIVHDTADVLGFTPRVRFEGPIDTAVPSAVATDLSAVLREALTNIAKHAGATTATVDVEIGDGVATARIRDNGRGLGAPTRRSGLANMRHRATRHNGIFDISNPTTGTGTVLTWTVPLPAT